MLEDLARRVDEKLRKVKAENKLAWSNEGKEEDHFRLTGLLWLGLGFLLLGVWLMIAGYNGFTVPLPYFRTATDLNLVNGVIAFVAGIGFLFARAVIAIFFGAVADLTSPKPGKTSTESFLERVDQVADFRERASERLGRLGYPPNHKPEPTPAQAPAPEKSEDEKKFSGYQSKRRFDAQQRAFETFLPTMTLLEIQTHYETAKREIDDRPLTAKQRADALDLLERQYQDAAAGLKGRGSSIYEEP